MSSAHSQSPRLRRVGTNTLESLSSLVSTTVQTVSFWLAVVLPLAYLPLLSDGISGSELIPFVALLAANVVTLTLGHEHAR